MFSFVPNPCFVGQTDVPFIKQHPVVSRMTRLEFVDSLSLDTVSNKRKTREIKRSEIEKRLRKPKNKFLIFRSFFSGATRNNVHLKSLDYISRLASIIWSRRSSIFNKYFTYLEETESEYYSFCYRDLIKMCRRTSTNEIPLSGISSPETFISNKKFDKNLDPSLEVFGAFEKNTFATQNVTSENRKTDDTELRCKYASNSIKLKFRILKNVPKITKPTKFNYSADPHKVTNKQINSSRYLVLPITKPIACVDSQITSVFQNPFSLIQMEDIFIFNKIATSRELESS